MEPFTYTRADTPAAAVKQANEHGTTFLAGGTTQLDLMKLDVLSPSRLVDINRLPFGRIEGMKNGGVRIGALVRNSDLAYHEVIRKRYPVLSEALLAGATAQLRNMATVGGNLMQRTRCGYFRDKTWACNKRNPGAGCSAIDGYSRSHALLGTSDRCIATHPSDMCVALAALDAAVVTLSPGGERRIPFGKFHVSYGDDPARETVLAPGDLITAVELPPTSFFARSHYIKIRDRASFEFALASAAAAMDLKDGTIRAARLALGGVATKPWRAVNAERVLVGAQANETTYRAAAAEALAGAKPQKFNRFKLELAQRVIVRVLTIVAGMP